MHTRQGDDNAVVELATPYCFNPLRPIAALKAREVPVQLLSDRSTTTRTTPRRFAGILVALVTSMLSLQAVGAGAALAADPVPRMYQDQAFATAGSAPTEDKPQSKLWFNDGSWWALMRTAVNGTDGDPDVTIHRLQADHTWLNTGVVVDPRSGSTGDALWEAGKLYVASRVTDGDIRTVRLSYDTARDVYTVDSGFPLAIPGGEIESVTIARDSLSRLWVTFTKPDTANAAVDRVWVAHSTTSDTTWAAPYIIPVSDSTIESDDISAITTFAGKVGVMWSDQQTQAMRFAVHPDTASDSSGWTLETPYSGTRRADDHINLKSLTDDDQGRIYAAVKTSLGDSSTDASSAPSLLVLSRSSTGEWTPSTVATVGEKLTRPQLVLDATNRQLYVVMATEAGGKVYYRKSPLGASMSFTARATLLSWSGALLNNPTTAKAPVTAASGMVVLAGDSKNTMRYYHAELDIPAAATTTPAPAPAPVASFTATPTSGTAPLAVQFTDTSTGGPTAWAWTFGDGTTSTAQNPSHTFTAAGSFPVTVKATNAAGSSTSAARTITVAAAPAPAPAPSITVGASTTASNSTAVTGVVVPRPAGVANGDVLVAQFTADANPSVTTAPAGWSTVVTPLSVKTNARVFAYYHVVTDANAEPASYKWALSTAVKWNAGMTAYRGVNTTTPFDTAATTKVNTTASASMAVPGVTTTKAGALLIGGVGVDSGSVAVTPPSGWTEELESTGVQVTETAHQARPTAGATGTVTWKLDRSMLAAGWVRALRPVS